MKRTFSEISKTSSLCIMNLDQFIDEKGFYKFMKKQNILDKLQQHNIVIEGVIKKKKKNYGFIVFPDQNQKDKFKQILEPMQIKVKNKTLQLKECTNEDQGKGYKKFKNIEETVLNNQNQAEQSTEQQQQIVDQEYIEQLKQTKIWEQVAPYYNLDYNQQLVEKRKALQKVLVNLKKELIKDGQQCYDVDNEKDSKYDLMKFQQIECDADNRVHYRNKSEFTIGYDLEGEVAIGFNKGQQGKGKMVVVEDLGKEESNGVVVSKEAIQIVKEVKKVIEEQIKEMGDGVINCYDRYTKQGYWRNLVIRQSDTTKQILINVIVSANNHNTVKIVERLSKMVKQIDGQLDGYQIVSVTLIESQSMNESLDYQTCVEHKVVGDSNCYEDIIMESKFRVHGNSFLQVNSRQCEKLYNKICELGLKGVFDKEKKKELVILDICSGIGTIGICMNKILKQKYGVDVYKIVAIEYNEFSCQMADHNRSMNGINEEQYTNVCNKVESCISEQIQLLQQQFREQSGLSGSLQIIGIVDPPRSGLQQCVIQALRTCKGLDRLVYVSCNAGGNMNGNLQGLCLCQSKKRKAPEFRIEQVVQVDLFPQTVHYETVVLLDRYYQM